MRGICPASGRTERLKSRDESANGSRMRERERVCLFSLLGLVRSAVIGGIEEIIVRCHSVTSRNARSAVLAKHRCGIRPTPVTYATPAWRTSGTPRRARPQRRTRRTRVAEVARRGPEGARGSPDIVTRRRPDCTRWCPRARVAGTCSRKRCASFFF